MSAIACWIAAHGSQQSRAKHGLGSRQAAKQVMIGVIFEELFDLFAVEVQLLLQGAQQFGHAYSQLALGSEALNWSACAKTFSLLSVVSGRHSL